MMKTRSKTLMVAVLLLGGCKSDAPESTSEHLPRPIAWTTVASLSSSDISQWPGVVTARREISMGFTLAGNISSRDVSLGDRVTSGSRLASIDSAPFRFSLLSAEAELSNAQVQLKNATAEEDRYAKLAKFDSITRSELDSARSSRKAIKALVDQAAATRANAGDQLENTVLKAEFDGIITGTFIDVGESVAPGQTVLTLANPAEREAIINVPESVANGLSPESPMKVALELDSSVWVEGAVRLIAPSANPVTRSFEVRIQLIGAPVTFRLGSTVIAQAATSVTEYVKIPASAVQNRGDQKVIWLYDSNTHTVSSMTIETAEAGNERLSILSDIDPQSVIVAAGVNSLSEGQIVKLGQEMYFD